MQGHQESGQYPERKRKVTIADGILSGTMGARMCASGGVLEWNLTSMTQPLIGIGTIIIMHSYISSAMLRDNDPMLSTR